MVGTHLCYVTERYVINYVDISHQHKYQKVFILMSIALCYSNMTSKEIYCVAAQQGAKSKVTFFFNSKLLLGDSGELRGVKLRVYK